MPHNGCVEKARRRQLFFSVKCCIFCAFLFQHGLASWVFWLNQRFDFNYANSLSLSRSRGWMTREKRSQKTAFFSCFLVFIYTICNSLDDWWLRFFLLFVVPSWNNSLATLLRQTAVWTTRSHPSVNNISVRWKRGKLITFYDGNNILTDSPCCIPHRMPAKNGFWWTLQRPEFVEERLLTIEKSQILKKKKFKYKVRIWKSFGDR